MATETELERMIIRLIGDGSSYSESLRKAEQETRDTTQRLSRDTDRLTDSGYRSMRGIRMLSSSLMMLARTKSAEQAMMSLGHVSMGMGYMFGRSGMLIGAGIGIGIAALQRLNHELRDKAVEAANKGFGAMATEGKDLGSTLADTNMAGFKEQVTDLVDTMNPSTYGGRVTSFWKVMSYQISQAITTGEWRLRGWSEFIKDKMAESRKLMKDIETEQKKFATSPEGKALLAKGASLRSDQQLSKLSEENDLREKIIGLNKEQAKYEKMYQDLIKHPGANTPAQLRKLEEQETRALGVSVKELTNRMKDEAATAGMLSDEKAIYDLLKWSHLDASREMLEEQVVTNALAKDIETFNAEMAGATKAQIAMAGATGRASKEVAYQKALMQDARRITNEAQTPVEKFNAAHKEMSELFDHGMISLETYTRAMFKAGEAVRGTSGAIDALDVGSGKAMEAIVAYRDTINLSLIPKPITGAAAASQLGSVQAAGEIETNRMLNLILQELQKANKSPAVQLAPGNLNK